MTEKTKRAWDDGFKQHYAKLEREDHDYVGMIAHTGGQCMPLSSTEMTVVVTMIGIFGKMLADGGPIADAVMRQVADLPDDAPQGYVEGVLLKSLRSLNGKFKKLGIGLEINRQAGIVALPPGVRRPDQTYGTFEAAGASGAGHGTVPSTNGGAHEHQSEHAERGHGREPAERSDPDVPQH